MSQKQFNLAKIIEINKKSSNEPENSLNELYNSSNEPKNSLTEPINNSNEQKQFK